MLHYNANTVHKEYNIWPIVYFPAKLGLKIDTFLTLLGTTAIPDSYSWEMDSPELINECSEPRI